MAPLHIETSKMEYGLVLGCALAFVIAVAVMFAGLPLVWISGAVMGLGVSAYTLMGLMRPRRVTLEADGLTLRPVLGDIRHYPRQGLAGFEEIISVPFASLILHFDAGNGRTRGITLFNRLAPAGLAVRHEGSEVGIMPSARLSVLQSWLQAAG